MSGVPPAVYVIWGITLAATLALFVPLAVYFLHRTWRAARSIERYAAETLVAAGGIARNTGHVSALDDTIATGGALLGAAGGIAQKLETLARVLGERTR